MLKEGTYFADLGKNGDICCVLKVWNDGSHNLKILSREVVTGKFNVSELHSRDEVRNLYKFLKEHFESEQKFTHEEYLEYVAAMKTDECPEELIDTEEKWRADLIAEFGADDE
jgi:hypothetical protein